LNKKVWFYKHRVPEGQKAYSMTKPTKVEHLHGCEDWWGGSERKNRQETEQAWQVGIDAINVRNFASCKFSRDRNGRAGKQGDHHLVGSKCFIDLAI